MIQNHVPENAKNAPQTQIKMLFYVLNTEREVVQQCLGGITATR
jgi:hypothetical protein